MKKVYTERFATSDDAMLIEHFKTLNALKEEGKIEESKQVQQAISHSLRRSIDTNKVIGMGMNADQTAVAVFVYDVVAEPGVFYKQEFDAERGEHFIWVPEEGEAPLAIALEC